MEKDPYDNKFIVKKISSLFTLCQKKDIVMDIIFSEKKKFHFFLRIGLGGGGVFEYSRQRFLRSPKKMILTFGMDHIIEAFTPRFVPRAHLELLTQVLAGTKPSHRTVIKRSEFIEARQRVLYGDA